MTLSIKKHPTARFGYFVQPEFFIYQHRCRRQLLEMAKEYFEAGRIRPKPGNPNVLVYLILSRPALVRTVAPFLEACLEFSARTSDYESFLLAIRLLEGGLHKSPEGLALLVELGYSMDMGGKQRHLPLDAILDRILRGHTPDTPRPE